MKKNYRPFFLGVGLFFSIVTLQKYTGSTPFAAFSTFLDETVRENDALATFFHIEEENEPTIPAMSSIKTVVLPPIVQMPVVLSKEEEEEKVQLTQTEEKPIWIFPLDGVITSGFAEREDPFFVENISATDTQYEFHTGIDISAATSTNIMAYQDGIVIRVGQSPGYGNHVLIQHSDSMKTLYAHCETIYVKTGQEVHTGESIAKAGSTGRSTAPHLHFEVRIDDVATNPMPYLQEK